MANDIKKKYMETTFEYMREQWHGPICETILKGAVSLAFDHVEPDLITPLTPEEIATISEKVNAYLDSVKDCKSEYCIICRVNRIVYEKKGGPSLIKGRWQELLLWITALLSNIAANEEVEKVQRTAAEDAMYVLAWLGAQSKVGEDAMYELAEIQDENKRLKDAVSVLTEHRGEKWSN